VQALEQFVIEKVVCGSDLTFVITSATENEPSHCFSWGCNSHAQLGHSHEQRTDLSGSSNKSSMQKVQSPTLIEGLEQANITDISCGNSHAFAWSRID
jgi:alpha-tubulin suppressor-like RCC1 family protein